MGSRSRQAIKRSSGGEIRSRTYCNLYGNMSGPRVLVGGTRIHSRHRVHFLYRIAALPRYHAETSLLPLSPSLSLSFRASASSWNITAMTNAFPYPVASILDANGPFHAGPCRYLMYLHWIHETVSSLSLLVENA